MGKRIVVVLLYNAGHWQAGKLPALLNSRYGWREEFFCKVND
jgi:hypothetical protein